MSKAMKKQVTKKKVPVRKKPANTMATLRAENDVLAERILELSGRYFAVSTEALAAQSQNRELIHAMRAVSSMCESGSSFSSVRADDILHAIRDFADAHLQTIDRDLDDDDDMDF